MTSGYDRENQTFNDWRHERMPGPAESAPFATGGRATKRLLQAEGYEPLLRHGRAESGMSGKRLTLMIRRRW